MKDFKHPDQFDFDPVRHFNSKERDFIMAIRKIREVGDDVLEKQCKKVDKMTLRTKISFRICSIRCMTQWESDLRLAGWHLKADHHH